MGERNVRAPMASTVIAVRVAPGAPVTVGQAVVIVEAMKMEHELCAGVDGTVAELLVKAGHVKVEKAKEILASLLAAEVA
jgi:biotin carboxyl carrier protein